MTEELQGFGPQGGMLRPAFVRMKTQALRAEPDYLPAPAVAGAESRSQHPLGWADWRRRRQSWGSALPVKTFDHRAGTERGSGRQDAVRLQCGGCDSPFIPMKAGNFPSMVCANGGIVPSREDFRRKCGIGIACGDNEIRAIAGALRGGPVPHSGHRTGSGRGAGAGDLERKRGWGNALWKN